MVVSYDKLWKLLIDKKMDQAQLCERTKISTNVIAGLMKNEDVFRGSYTNLIVLQMR